MQTILEKACQSLTGDNNMVASGSYRSMINQGTMDTGIANFPSFQDLHIYGGGEQQLDMQQQIDRLALDAFLPTSSTDDLCLGKKRSNPYSCSGKSPLIWAEDLRLQEDSFRGDQLQMGPCSIDGGTDIDSLSDVYETKPFLSSDGAVGEKKHEASTKLERPSPRRVDRMSPMMKLSPKNLSYGSELQDLMALKIAEVKESIDEIYITMDENSCLCGGNIISLGPRMYRTVSIKSQYNHNTSGKYSGPESSTRVCSFNLRPPS
ncbi:Myb family transcription factor APL [Acorus gramineus]|uniref:Myb family transcription factor APL n=1 Tax=Acorus gramineus TaxID=55184 RepID=A0AAV9BVE5_ACOGR|nr:Myb family transcription factor APL [Acorus gramineus]